MEIIRPSFKEIMDRIPFRELEAAGADIVVGIGRGGLPVAALVAYSLGVPMVSARASLYDDSKPARKISQEPLVELRGMDVAGKKALAVDDVSNTGATLAAVKRGLLGKGAAEVRTFALYGASDFSKEKFEKCVKLPWERAYADI